MARKECIDIGCSIGALKMDVDRLINPETGAIGQMHEKINRKVSWPALYKVLGIILLMVSGSYAYTTITTTSIRDTIKETNAVQDKQAEEFRQTYRQDMQAFRTDIQAMTAIANKTASALDAHRAYTEGIQIGKGKRK